MLAYTKGLAVVVGVLALSTSAVAAPKSGSTVEVGGYEKVDYESYEESYAVYGGSGSSCGNKCKQPKGAQLSTDGRCGKGISCYGSGFGDCCSGWAYCGSNPEHCGEGCQEMYGQCGAPALTSSSSITSGACASGSTSVPGTSSGSKHTCVRSSNTRTAKPTSTSPISTSSKSLLVSTVTNYPKTTPLTKEMTTSINGSSPVTNNKYSDCASKTITVVPSNCPATTGRPPICVVPDCILLQKIQANCDCPVSDLVYTSTVTLPCSNTCMRGCGVDYSTIYTPCPATPVTKTSEVTSSATFTTTASP